MPVYENERGTYLFNSKDLCMIEHIPELLESGIDSLKVEGGDKVSDIVMDERPYPVASLAVQPDGDRMRIDWTRPVVPAEYVYVRETALMKMACIVLLPRRRYGMAVCLKPATWAK